MQSSSNINSPVTITQPTYITNNIELLNKLKILYNDIITNDFYKEIYNKFIYLPIKNNIQLIIKYYPLPNCPYDVTFDPLTSKCYYQIDKTNEDHNYVGEIINKSPNYIGYFRKKNHLATMFDENYYNFITIDNYTFGTKNITLPNKNINPIPYILWNNKYIICPTLDPVHTNHLIIILKEPRRAHEFYFDASILKDMFEFVTITGQYLYNSIELGSIPEKIHFHTSNEVPPINNVTKMVENILPLYTDIKIKMWKLNQLCHIGYYFEIDNNGLDRFTKMLPAILFNSLFDKTHKYMAQLFICPKMHYDFYRVIITFRRASINNIVPIDGKFKQEYYNELFGNKIELCYGKYIGMTGNLRFNILGYEPIQYNYTNMPIDIIEDNDLKAMKDYCFNNTHVKLNEYCKLFHFNQIFENNVAKIFTKNTRSSKIINTFYYLPAIYFYKINNIKKLYSINDNSYIGSNNNNIYMFEKINSVNMIKYINNYKLINKYYPQYTDELISIVNSQQHINGIYLVKKSIISNIETFIKLKSTYKNSLYALIYYQLYLFYVNFNMVYENITLDDIFVKKQHHMRKCVCTLNMIDNYIIDTRNIVPVFTNLHKFKKGTLNEYNDSITKLKHIIGGSTLTTFPHYKLNTGAVQHLSILCNKSIGEIITFAAQNSSSLTSFFTQFTTYTLPIGTKMVSGTNTYDLNASPDMMADVSWYHKERLATWFTSPFDMGTLVHPSSEYKYISHKGLNGCNADWYVGMNPTNIGRHMIFELNRGCQFKLLTFNLLHRIKIHHNIIILFVNIFIPNRFTLLPINDNNVELENHPLFKYLKKNNIKEDAIVVFILRLLLHFKLINFDGYIDIDFIKKRRLYKEEGKTTVEYVSFNPNIVRLIGVFFYDYYNAKHILFRNMKEWNNYVKNNIIRTGQIQTDATPQMRKENIIDVINYSEINKYYIENLSHITSDSLILKNNDFLNGTNSNIYFNNNLIDRQLCI